MSLRPRSVVPFLLGVFLVLLTSFPAFAQLNLGRVFGAITDQTGGVIVGATVTVIDVERGVTRPLTSDSAGEYSAPSLIPGMYTVRAEAKGFKAIERTDIVVGVGQDVRVDLSLQPGEQTQTVTVTGEAPEINTSNAQLGSSLERQEINDLPLNGRQYTDLLKYQPGILPVPGSTVQIVPVNGMRAQDQVWMLDGMEDYNAFSAGGPVIGGSATGGDQSSILPLDAIQEVNILEDPKAEYGWKPGAVVNVGLKSGTNNIHGTAYGLGRDTPLDARSQFLAANFPKEQDNLEQFGASIGGPIKKDKLFYFGNYEGQRYTIGSPKTVQIPSSVAGGGTAASFPDAILALESHGVTPSPLSLNLAGCTAAGVCNPADGIFNNSSAVSGVSSAITNIGGSDNLVAKFDYHLNDHNSFNGDYVLGDGHENSAGSGVQPYWRGGSTYFANVVRGVWVWTPNSTWVNEARFGYDGVNLPSFPAECENNLGQPSYTSAFGFVSGAGSPPQCGFPLLTISGFTQLGAAAGTNIRFGTWSGSDSVSYTRGKHLFKFGGEIHDTRFVGAIKLTNITGTLSFGTGSTNVLSGAGITATPLEDFLGGLPSSGQLLIGNSQRHISMDRYAGFAQDDWRVTPRITVNLGVRYEYRAPITEANNLLGNFDPNTQSGLIQETSGTPVFNGDPNDFAPRIGLAWDVTGKGTTVVRAGGGIVYETLNLNTLTQTPNGAQLNAIPTGFTLYEVNGSTIPSPGNINVGSISLSSSQLPWQLNNPVFNNSASALTCGNGLGKTNPGAGTGGANPANPAPCSIAAMNPNFRTPYVTNWNLAVQHAFSNSLAVTVGYVGNHGTKLGGLWDVNQPTPGQANGSSAPSSEAEQIRRPYYSQFPYLSRIVYYTDDMESNYNALQVNATQRLSHGLSFTANYVYAHAIDQNSQENSSAVMDSKRMYLEYGDATYDARQHFTLTMTYMIPGKKGYAQMLQGWQVNTAVNMMTPFTFNALDTTSDLSGTGESADRWTLVGPASAFNPGGPSPLPCWGVSKGTGTGAFAGGSFASAANCTKVAAGASGALTSANAAGMVSNMPAACIAAAAAETTNPTVVAANDKNATGLMSLANHGCYMQGNAVIVPPAQGTYGTMGRDVLRQFPYQDVDLSVFKNWTIKERYTTQFRVEFFNLFNSAEFAAPTANPAVPTTFGQSQQAPNASNPVIGSGGPRTVQLFLKFIF